MKFDPKRILTIGAIGDYNYHQIAPWVNSLNRSGFSGRKILLSYNSNKHLLDRLIKEGIEVYTMEGDSFGKKVDKFPCHTGFVNKDNTELLVHHIRFWHMYQLIREIGEESFDYVIHTDVRDVVFQKDPSEWIANFWFRTNVDDRNHRQLYKHIVAPSEYLTYDEEPWNGELALTNFGPYIKNYVLRDSLVYNVGSFVARTDAFLNLSLFTYLLCNRRNKLADQPSQALLFSTILKDRVYTAETKDAWALQCGTLHENYEKFKDKLRGKPAFVLNDEIVNENNVPYSIIHQYDRVPQFKTLLEDKFGEA